MTIEWQQGPKAPTDGDPVCRDCGGLLYEDLGAYEDETEGQMADRLAGFNRVFWCESCGSSELYSHPPR